MATRSQATDRTTLQELFRYLLRTEKDYPYDLGSPRLPGVISEVFHLTDGQARQALKDLEQRKLIEIVRSGDDVRRVAIAKRDWRLAPESPI